MTDQKAVNMHLFIPAETRATCCSCFVAVVDKTDQQQYNSGPRFYAVHLLHYVQEGEGCDPHRSLWASRNKS